METVLTKEFWTELSEQEQQQLFQLHRLIKIMAQLREPSGCPWDRQQTHESLKPYLIEEAYEVLEQLEINNMVGIQEELGDLLLQVIFHAQIANETGKFNIGGVAKGISDKLMRRHPHIFGDVEVENAQEVLVNWEKIKQQEKLDAGVLGEHTSFLDQVNPYQPALMEAQELQKKAAKVNFDWDDLEAPLAKVTEEFHELIEAHNQGDGDAVCEELGDLLFAVVNVARFMNTHSELALRQTNQKFRRRFHAIEERVAKDGLKMEELSLEVLDGYWDEVKAQERANTMGDINTGK